MKNFTIILIFITLFIGCEKPQREVVVAKWNDGTAFLFDRYGDAGWSASGKK